MTLQEIVDMCEAIIYLCEAIIKAIINLCKAILNLCEATINAIINLCKAISNATINLYNEFNQELLKVWGRRIRAYQQRVEQEADIVELP